MIRVENLEKSFQDASRGEVRAVDGVSFEARPGRILGLLGPNGAGKTTTLRMIATILRPTGGRIVVAGHDVATDPEAVRRQIGFLSGATGVYERLTAREVLVYFARLHGMTATEAAARAAALIRLFDLGEIADGVVGKFSSGQRQKVSIARALVHDPPVVILDEPTVSLDVLVARAVVDFVARLRDEGKCVVLSSHVMSEVERLCDEVVVIDRGQVRAHGSVDEIRGAGTLEDAFFALVESPYSFGADGR